MDRLMRLREPAAVIALVGLGLHLVLSLFWAAGSPGPLGSTLASLANMIAEPVLLVLLTAFVVACWLDERSPHARGLTVIALVLTAALLVGVVAMTIASFASARTDGWKPSFLPWIAAPITVAAVSLLVQGALLRRPLPVLAPVSEPVADPEAVAADPQLEPGWTPEAAVGTVWRRAGDAGTEGPATSWEAPGQAHPWWGPAPNQELPAAPPRHNDE